MGDRWLSTGPLPRLCFAVSYLNLKANRRAIPSTGPAVRNLTDQQNARVRGIVQRELCTRIPAQLHLAPLLGITQASLSRFLDGQCGLGAATALRIAFLVNRSVEDILGLERDVGLLDPEEERYPSRLLTARAAYLDGVPLANIRRVLGISIHLDSDPGPRWWRNMMEAGHLAKLGNRAKRGSSSRKQR